MSENPNPLKYTPGPWDWLAIGANASGGFHLYIIDSAKRKIAALWGKAEEKEANAKLITAAPDMLDALRQWQSAEAQFDVKEIENARTSRDAAIHRALGTWPSLETMQTTTYDPKLNKGLPGLHPQAPAQYHVTVLGDCGKTHELEEWYHCEMCRSLMQTKSQMTK